VGGELSSHGLLGGLLLINPELAGTLIADSSLS
jgi:hypothetical protein